MRGTDPTVNVGHGMIFSDEEELIMRNKNYGIYEGELLYLSSGLSVYMLLSIYISWFFSNFSRKDTVFYLVIVHNTNHKPGRKRERERRKKRDCGDFVGLQLPDFSIGFVFEGAG